MRRSGQRVKTLLNGREHWQQKESSFRKKYDDIESISIDLLFTTLQVI